MRKSAIACGLLASAAFTSPVWANADVTKLSADPNNWAIQSGDYAGTRFSKLDQINASNVGTMKVAWTFSTGVLRGHEGSPLVIGDMMYLHSAFPNNVYALNLADDNKIVWQYSPKQDPSVIPVMCCDTVNRGVQYAEGKIFLHQADTSLVALDAKTGKELWKAVNADPKRGETGTGAPLVTKDKVIFGGRDKRLHCVRRDNGEVIWTFPTRGKVDSSPVVCDGKVVVGSEDGRLYLVSLTDGAELWNYEIGRGITSSPAVADGRVVVGSEDGSVYCFGTKK